MLFSLTPPEECKTMRSVCWFCFLWYSGTTDFPFRVLAPHACSCKGWRDLCILGDSLISFLKQLVAVNNPDKIIFVGEALVGNEAVDQLVKFDRALRDFSSASGTGKGRGIDGMLITKWDTVDDKVTR